MDDRTSQQAKRYFAFLSYSHADKEVADWLHRELENFAVPRSLVGRLSPNGVIPKQLRPIFRDEHELAAADDLNEEIKEALASSQVLIVLCSPSAAQSRWTNAEIDTFKRAHPEGCVFAAIAGGDFPADQVEQCFPPALKQKYDRLGRPTGKHAEPLAADIRGTGDERRTGFLKLVAGMLGVGLDELVQRENTQRQRRLAILTAASLAGMAVTSTLAVTSIQARDAARDQRREAEGLLAFMLGDLKDKLEPIGKLDALDGVGSRVLAYYSKQNMSDLSDAGLLQRSRALSLTAEVAYLRGDMDKAQLFYEQAAQGTMEAVKRDPDDPQRLFDHAQNVYYLGDIAARHGQFDRAEKSFREYRSLAGQMVALDSDNLKWRMEVQYAEANLGIVLLKQRRFAEAADQFAGALRTIEAVAAIDPANDEYQKSVAESLAWLADAKLAAGQLSEATAARRRQIALIEKMSRATGDVEFRQRLIPARQKLGQLLAMTGNEAAAKQELSAAVEAANALLAVEPANTKWINYASSAKLELAALLLASGSQTEAAAQAESACGMIDQLMERDATLTSSQTLSRSCFKTRGEIALAGNAHGPALAYANRAVKAATSVSSGDAAADRHGVASAYRLVGDIHMAGGNTEGAKAAWNRAAQALPRAAESPGEMSERLAILQRLGRSSEAANVRQRLARMGFRKGTATV